MKSYSILSRTSDVDYYYIQDTSFKGWSLTNLQLVHLPHQQGSILFLDKALLTIINFD